MDLFWMLRAEKNSDENGAENLMLSVSDYKEKRCNCQQIKPSYIPHPPEMGIAAAVT